LLVIASCDIDPNDPYNPNTPAPVPVSGVSLNKDTLRLALGETETLTATVSPADADNKKVTWRFGDSAVATVSPNGVVTPVKIGTTTITVTTADGGYTAQCAVTIFIVAMVRIPAGTFTMGSPETEANRQTDETQHQVTLTKSFYMGKYQVTQEQYQAVMGNNPSYFTGAVAGESGTPSKLPVEYVTWYDAVEFCNKSSVLEGLQEVYTISGRTPEMGDPIISATVTVDWNKNGYRLPTEGEWEYACRARTTMAYNTGGATISDRTGWYNANSGSKTHKVGLKPANNWGLYDMHGNVWEWCWDWYGDYASGAQTDPTGAVTGAGRVVHGGNWSLAGSFLRSARRFSYDPLSRYGVLGFRVVRGE
jgi:formylglycine-generating enzyme required for sulfatase activity